MVLASRKLESELGLLRLLVICWIRTDCGHILDLKDDTINMCIAYGVSHYVTKMHNRLFKKMFSLVVKILFGSFSANMLKNMVMAWWSVLLGMVWGLYFILNH